MKTDVQTQQGFTLIELMIVVAIIGILAAIAIPQYQNYVIRSQVSEGLSLAGGQKTAVEEYYSNRGTLPTTNTQAGLPNKKSITGKYVSQVNISKKGVIKAKFASTGKQKANNALKGKVLALSPYTNSTSTLKWSCSPSAGTTIKPKYLPTNCRS